MNPKVFRRNVNKIVDSQSNVNVAPTKSRVPLKDKRERFCQEYLIDLNGTQAAIRAGYSQRTAKVIASEMLTKPDIVDRLSELRKRLAAKLSVTPERIINELARIGFGDARRVMSWGPGGVTLRDSSELTDDEAAIVSEVSETTTKDGGSIRLKCHSKEKALDLLGRHLGLWEENANSVNVMVPVIVLPALQGPVDEQIMAVPQARKDLITVSAVPVVTNGTNGH